MTTDETLPQRKTAATVALVLGGCAAVGMLLTFWGAAGIAAVFAPDSEFDRHAGVGAYLGALAGAAIALGCGFAAILTTIHANRGIRPRPGQQAITWVLAVVPAVVSVVVLVTGVL